MTLVNLRSQWTLIAHNLPFFPSPQKALFFSFFFFFFFIFLFLFIMTDSSDVTLGLLSKSSPSQLGAFHFNRSRSQPATDGFYVSSPKLVMNGNNNSSSSLKRKFLCLCLHIVLILLVYSSVQFKSCSLQVLQARYLYSRSQLHIFPQLRSIFRVSGLQILCKGKL